MAAAFPGVARLPDLLVYAGRQLVLLAELVDDGVIELPTNYRTVNIKDGKRSTTRSLRCCHNSSIALGGYNCSHL